ncbi:MAG: metallophosphoesterase [Patescibacteria group bacterium]
MNYLFDALIIAFLTADGVGMLVALQFWDGWQRLWFYKGWLVLALLAWLVIFYGSFIEPRLLLVAREEIKLGSAPTETLSVALISDLHVGPYKKADYIEKVVAKTLSLKPDIILLAGDFVYDNQNQTEYLAPLKKLQAPYGVFAIMGNHDYGDHEVVTGAPADVRASTVRSTLTSMGIKILINEGVKIHKGSKDIFLLGTDELWTKRANIEQALESFHLNKIPHPSILVTHNPDLVIQAQSEEIDLVLAGHTHGGQIRLPFLGSVPPIPDELGRKYDRGLFAFGKTQLFITSGAGEMGPRARLLVPPEVALLEVKF